MLNYSLAFKAHQEKFVPDFNKFIKATLLDLVEQTYKYSFDSKLKQY